MKAKHVPAHIANTLKCRAARDRQLMDRGTSPLANSSSKTNPPALDPMEAGMGGFVEHETDFCSSERLMSIQAIANGCEPLYQSHQTTVEEVENDDAPGRYAEDYNSADVAHIL